MALNPININVSNTAMVHILDTLLPRAEWPTDGPEEALPAGVEELGLISEDGEEVNRTVETVAINAHQLANARVVATGGSLTIALSALEDNPIVRKFWHGAAATAGVTTIKAEGVLTGTVFYSSWDTQAGYEKKERYIGHATITPNGAAVRKRGEATLYPLLITFQGEPVHVTEA